MTKKRRMTIIAITALAVVISISTLASQLLPLPFGADKGSTSTTALPSPPYREVSTESNSTKSKSEAQLISQGTLERPELTSTNEDSSANTQLSSVNFTSFRNSTYGIQVRYPSNWDVVDVDTDNDGTIDIAGFVSPDEDRFDRYKERLWLSLDTVPQKNMTLEQYSHQVINHSRDTLDDFELLDSNSDSIILAGRPAYKFVHVWTLNDDRIIKQMEIGTKIGDKVYYLDYYAEEEKYAEYLPIIQEMVNSFEIER